MRFTPNALTALVFTLSTSLLTACGGDGGDPQSTLIEEPSTETQTQAITGGAIKGPLANATVTVYGFDSSQAGFKGAVIATGVTDASAAITGLNLPEPLTPPYIMEFTSTPGSTSDITTGVFPFIPTLSTVLTQALIDTGEPVYATPLTSLAVDVAINSSTDSTTATEFLVSLAVAATQVVETVGFGMSTSIDIFATPPLVNEATDTTAELSDVLAYRTAIEALAAVTFQMQQDASTTSDVVAIISELAKDLSDGVIDASVNGVSSTVYNNTTLIQLTQDPTGLTIPNTTDTVADVSSILVDETRLTGSTTTTTELSDGSITVTITSASTTTSTGVAVWDAFNWDDGSAWQ